MMSLAIRFGISSFYEEDAESAGFAPLNPPAGRESDASGHVQFRIFQIPDQVRNDEKLLPQ